MRQLASVYEKQHFNNELWLRKLRDAFDEAGNWQIKFDDVDGKIKVIEKEGICKRVISSSSGISVLKKLVKLTV
ncbi:hypothetical protein [Photobacterium leiognathi]|uniref:hypothetical protein n=1 Tax=Photobacterium leiognathi TaxID=553611 RepID=UPI0027328130|nr:hypothetical protein [Photobacterium leiognathi]